eukprot:SAG11_NODE_6296_length_1343_cov_0.862540_2_plen_85_part_00
MGARASALALAPLAFAEHRVHRLQAPSDVLSLRMTARTCRICNAKVVAEREVAHVAFFRLRSRHLKRVAGATQTRDTLASDKHA